MNVRMNVNKIPRPPGEQSLPRDLQFRVYGRQEFAVIYFPWFSSPDGASRALTRLIYNDGELLASLESAGFRKGAKRLTPAMVGVLVQYMGSPRQFHEIMNKGC